MGRGKQRGRLVNSRWEWPSGDGKAPGLADLKAASYEVARQAGGHVDATSDGSFPPNFHHVVIAFRDRRLWVLSHQFLPLLALATPPADASIWPLSFVDDPAIGPTFAGLLRVRLLTAAELEQDLTRAATSPPTAFAYEQDLKYWRPESVGDVIFNGWD